MQTPPDGIDTIASIAGEWLQARLGRNGSSTIRSIAQFLEMDLEPRTLYERVILRTFLVHS